MCADPLGRTANLKTLLVLVHRTGSHRNLRANTFGSTIRGQTIWTQKTRQQPSCWIEAAATADLQDNAASMNGRRSHRRHAFPMPLTCEATTPHSRTNLQLVWAIVAHTCSDNQRGRNNNLHDVQSQEERTHAYRSSVAVSFTCAYVVPIMQNAQHV